MKLPNELMKIIWDYYYSLIQFEKNQVIHSQLLHVHSICMLKAIFSVTRNYNNNVKAILYILKNLKLQMIRLNEY